MRIKLNVVFFALAVVLPGLVLAAGERGTPDEAQALVAKAIAMYEASGRDATFAAIENPDGGLVDRDLYVFVYGPDRTVVAHGFDASLKGTQTDTIVDVDGLAFGTRLQDDATEAGAWVDYKWNDPVTREVLPKTSWVVRHDGYVFGVGVYKP